MAKIENPLIVIGGGSSAYIVVTAPAGSLLTCGTQTYQLGTQETEHQFTITVLGTYTVTATFGDKHATETVLVDAWMAYKIILVAGLFLYENGNECFSQSGGWEEKAVCPFGDVIARAHRLTKYDDYMNLYATAEGAQSWNYSGISAFSVLKIDVTNYTRLFINYSLTLGTSAHLGVSESNTDLSNASTVTLRGGGNTYTDFLSIVDITGDVYVFMYDRVFYYNGPNYRTDNLSIYNIWLE